MSLTLQEIQNTKTDTIGFFRYQKMPSGKYLITNDPGRFHFLSQSNFKKFISGNVEELDDYNELVKKGFIKTPDYQRWSTISYMQRSHFVGTGPTLHMMVLTLRCNHHCRYCHAAVAPITATQYDMDKETATKVVDTILHTNSHFLTIEFQGGEALLNWEVLKHVVEYARVQAEYLGKEVLFNLVTNLTLMTEEKLQWLIQNNVPVCTSLDGDIDNHNHNRTGYDGNSHAQVTYWIQRVNEVYEEKKWGTIGALLTVTKKNLPDYKKIIDSYVSLGLKSIFLRWLNPYGFAAADFKELAYDSDEWINFYTSSMDYIIELNRQGVEFRENITTIYLTKIFQEKDPGFMDIRSPSGIATGGVAYNYDGKVYASDESRMLGRMGIDDFLMTELKETGAETYHAMMNSEITKIATQSSCLDGLPGYNDHVYKPYLGVDIIHNFKMTDSLFVPLKKDDKMKLQFAILDYIFEKLAGDDYFTIDLFEKWGGYKK